MQDKRVCFEVFVFVGALKSAKVSEAALCTIVL